MDASELKLVRDLEFTATDFTITDKGFCKFNPQLARKIVAVAVRAMTG
jgi:hypothetical protein